MSYHRLAELLQECPDISAAQAARRLNVCEKTVYNWAKNLEHKFSFGILGYAYTAQMLGRRSKGWTGSRLAEIYGVQRATIYAKCNRYGLTDSLVKFKKDHLIWDAVLRQESYKDFRVNENRCYQLALRLGLLARIKDYYEN